MEYTTTGVIEEIDTRTGVSAATSAFPPERKGVAGLCGEARRCHGTHHETKLKWSLCIAMLFPERGGK